jgi:TonB family protein
VQAIRIRDTLEAVFRFIYLFPSVWIMATLPTSGSLPAAQPSLAFQNSRAAPQVQENPRNFDPVNGKGGVSQPTILSKVQPEYSEEARIARLQGSVVLSIVVDANGTPRDFQVLRPLGLGLDEMAIAAVGQWRFNPGLKGGMPVNVRATVEVNFRLLSGPLDGWFLTHVSFSYPPSAQRPKIKILRYQDLPHPAQLTGNYQVDLDIDTEGNPQDVTISGLPPVDLDVFAAEIRKWRFEPAKTGDTPVKAHASLTLAWMVAKP